MHCWLLGSLAYALSLASGLDLIVFVTLVSFFLSFSHYSNNYAFAVTVDDSPVSSPFLMHLEREKKAYSNSKKLYHTRRMCYSLFFLLFSRIFIASSRLLSLFIIIFPANLTNAAQIFACI